MINNQQTNTYRAGLVLLLLVAMTVLSACGGANGASMADMVAQVAQQSGAADEDAAGAGAVSAAKATVSARSLRVRSEPSVGGTVVGGIKEGEEYDVIGLSSDGEWVQLAIPALPSGSGWVSTNFVSVAGAITEAPVTTVTAPAPVTTTTGTTGTTTVTATQPLNLIAAAPGTATVQTEGLRLRVRAQPSTEAEIVGYVYEGEIYPVVERSEDGLWTQLGGRPNTDNVNGGWVATEFLVLN